MPYIKTDYRPSYDKVLNQIQMIGTKGELEYCIFKLMLMYMSQRESKYTNLHDTTYAAMHCADEFRRRFLDKREDEAMQENGDITL
jgi:hypothetical protein